MMKDMSLEELLDDLCFYADVSDEHYKIETEILRRFEVLEKELKATKLAHAVEKDIMQTNFDQCKTAAEHWKKVAEDLKCCGNCTNYRYGNLCDGKLISCDSWCDSWTTDSLTRAERGGG